MRNPELSGGLGRRQRAEWVTGFQGTCENPDSAFTKGALKSLDWPTRAEGTRGAEGRGKICTRNMERKGGLGRWQYAVRPAEYRGTTSSDLTIETPRSLD